MALYFPYPGAFRGNKAQKASRFQSVCCEMHMASIFWWTTSWNLIKIRFPLPERTMRLIILTPNALHDVYTVSAGQDFFGMYASCLSMKKKKINIPLGFTIWPAWSSRRLIELGWDAASTNTLMPGQLDMLNAFDSLLCEPWCVQLNMLHLHAPVQPDYTLG